jgi:tetratricopeptide (TPR) repeat protein
MKKPSLSFIISCLSLLALLIGSNTSLFSKVFALVEGKVQSADGKPIAGARVIMIFNEDGSKIELTTDKKGMWRKANLRPGAYTIGFIADGYEPENFNVNLSAIKKNPSIDVKLSPIPESPFAKGDALYEQEKYEEALEEYQKVIEENPDLYQAFDKIGICYLRLDDQEKAIEYFKKMLEHDPQSLDTLINLSAIYFEQGNLEEGMKYFKQLDESTLTDKGTFYNIGVLLFKSNQIDMAIDYLRKCVTIEPGFVDGYYQLGLANLNKGDMEEAKKNFKKVIELAPESEKAAAAKSILENIK